MTPAHPALASLVFFSSGPAGLAAVLRALGVDLEHEEHDDEVEHWASELGDIHVAVYGGESCDVAPGLRARGSTFPGLYVADLGRAVVAAVAVGARDLSGHQQRPWGCRVIVEAPGGFVIEVNQKNHCRADDSSC